MFLLFYKFLAMLFYCLLILLWFYMVIHFMIHGLLRTNVELFFPRTSFSTKKGLRNKTAWMSCRELIFKFILTVQILYTKWIYIFTGKCVENFGRCTRRNKGANFLTKMCFWLCQSFHWLKQFAMWPPRFDTDKDSFTEHISILWWWSGG